MFYVQRSERDGINGQYLGLIMFSFPTPLFIQLRVT